MAKPRSGFKRRPYEPPEGVQIEVKTREVWDLLTTVARAAGLTLGQWAETRLVYARSGDPYIPPARPLTATPTKLPRPRHFKISERLFDDIVADMGKAAAAKWIPATLIPLARIELVRLRGLVKEPDRFW